MKDMTYFLTEETKFCVGNSDDGDYFYNEKYGEMDGVGSDDQMNFLIERPFFTYYNQMKEASDKKKNMPWHLLSV